MLTSEQIHHLSAELTRLTGKPVAVREHRPLRGGDINIAFELISGSGSYFVKMNSAARFPGMFEAEAAGLNLLRQTNGVRIPEVIGSGEVAGASYLLLEMVIPAPSQKDYWEVAGRSLASLHMTKGQAFGLAIQNYIGSLPQLNGFCDDGAEFLITRRLKPQVTRAFNSGLLTKVELEKFEGFYKRLPGLIPCEKPSLLHGDLWNGNLITGPDGYAWFIDPAVYYGHRETDLALTRLFGGFDDDFYEAYHEALPLLPGWEERVPLFQLYPLLVHLNLFGAGYKHAVMNIIR